MSEALVPGTRLGPYEISALIGAGGMGQVYRALDPRLSRHVAIKTLSSAVAAAADGDRRVKILDFGIAELISPPRREDAPMTGDSLTAFGAVVFALGLGSIPRTMKRPRARASA